MSDSSASHVRPITPADVPAVVAMVHDLAAYERAPDECHLTAEQLSIALFGPSAALFGHVAGEAGSAPVGFALWFLNFSTWRGVHGIYLEDLYVRPEARGTGLARALLSTLAGLCLEQGYARLDWSVLHWNTPAREVYHALGAEPLDEWVPYRVEGESLVKLARTGQDPGVDMASTRHRGRPAEVAGSPSTPHAS